jgi:Kef-type K+ transport system membrane component KefB
METNTAVFTVFIIFAGAALFSTAALYLRQSLLVAYMLFGVVCGPCGLKAIPNIDSVHKLDDIAIILFMFLLGLHLQPQNLMRTMGKTVWVTLISSLVFFVLGFAVSYWHNYSLEEGITIGICMMFSSTIVTLKLFTFSSNNPNNQHTGEVMISVLLLQDIIAVIALFLISTMGAAKSYASDIILLILALPSILLFGFLMERYLLNKVFAKFTGIHEYMMLVAISWCLGVAQLAKTIGLSYEIGAFIAGVSIAASPIAFYIDEQLKPLRDFFLVLFFFVIGASFDFQYLSTIIIPAISLTILFIISKPLTFYLLLCFTKETKNTAKEVSLRLSQLSEFSLLVVLVAYQNEVVSHSVIYLIQTVTMLMFIISSYSVGVSYPTRTLPVTN